MVKLAFEADSKTLTDSQHPNPQYQVNQCPVGMAVAQSKMGLIQELLYSTEQVIGGNKILKIEG